MKTDDFLFEMSNLRKRETGLPVNIYVSSGGSVNKQRAPRIKAQVSSGDKFTPYETFSIMLKRDIDPADVVGYDQIPSHIFAPIKEFIYTNYDVLIAYWNDEMSTSEMLAAITSIGNIK